MNMDNRDNRRRDRSSSLDNKLSHSSTSSFDYDRSHSNSSHRNHGHNHNNHHNHNHHGRKSRFSSSSHSHHAHSRRSRPEFKHPTNIAIMTGNIPPHFREMDIQSALRFVHILNEKMKIMIHFLSKQERLISRYND